MAECGVVRYDFPAMFVQRDWTPEFEAEWLDLVGAGPTEREQLMDISDAHRRALFSQLSAVGQELGLDPWSDDATLLSVVVELSEVVGDDHVDAALRRIANERAGHSEPPQSRAERPVAERFARIFTAVGTSLEDEIAQQLGEARARELRLAQDGWPGLKYQGGGRECRTEAEAEAESRPDESPSDGSPPQ